MKNKFRIGEIVIVNGKSEIYQKHIKAIGIIESKDYYYNEYLVNILSQNKEDWFKEDDIEIVMERKIKKKDKDLTIMKMSKYGTATSTDAENTDILLIRLEDALTKIQEARRRAMDSYHKIEIEDKRFEFDADKEKADQNELDKLDEVLKNIGGII